MRDREASITEPEDLKDLQDMIDIIDFTIEVNAHQQYYYRRSASLSTRDVAKALYLEMADEAEGFLSRLRARRQKLWDAIGDLWNVERNRQ